MTKADLVDDVANAAELTKKDAERLVEIVFETIIQSLNKGEKIAVVYAAGDITSGKSQFGGSGEETIGSDSLTKVIDEVRDDKSIKAVVLRIDSPGGSGLASDIIWRAIE